MEPIATTALDGPQHYDILAAHRLHGDEIDSFSRVTSLGVLRDGDATMGDNSAGRFVSIDGSTNVEYYHQNNLAISVYDSNHRLPDEQI